MSVAGGESPRPVAGVWLFMGPPAFAGSGSRPMHLPPPDRGKPLACGICHAGVLELGLAPRNRTALYSLLTLARWFPLIHR